MMMPNFAGAPVTAIPIGSARPVSPGIPGSPGAPVTPIHNMADFTGLDTNPDPTKNEYPESFFNSRFYKRIHKKCCRH